MKQTALGPSGLRWTVKRLIVPTGMRPLTRTDMLDVASPRRSEKLSQQSQPHDGPPVVGTTGPAQFGK